MKISHIQEVITEPVFARKYINDFYTALGKDGKTGYVDTSERRIEFSSMTDDDAIWVANQFKSMTSEAARNRRQNDPLK